MKAVYNFTLAIILMFGLALASPMAHATPPNMEDFFERPDFYRPALSPNGQYLAYVKREGDEQFIVSIDLEAKGGDMKSVPIGTVETANPFWLGNERLAITTRGYLGRRTGKTYSREKVRDMREDGKDIWKTVRSETLLIVMDRDGKNPVTMFQNSALRQKDVFRSRLEFSVPDDDDHIIMSASSFDARDVRGSFRSFRAPTHLYRVNLQTGDETRIESGNKDTQSWFTDRAGNAVMRWDAKEYGLVLHVYAKRDGKWVKVKERLSEDISNNIGEAFELIAPSPDPTKYYALARPEGERQVNLYLYDVNTDSYGEALVSRPGVDIRGATVNRKTLELQSVIFSGPQDNRVFEDENSDAHMQGLIQYFGTDAVITPYQTDESETKWLLDVMYPNEHRSYYIYNKETRSPVSLGHPNSAFNGKTLAEMTVVDYKARDGMELFGYLSRPAGVDPKKKMPLVMFVHGGPEARDFYGWDIWSQIMVANGYQVFQPQFRGSTGQGQDYAEAGYRQWGKAMQSDVDDAFEHLIQQGLVDRDKACIMGFSYGGYAAMAGATVTPNQWQCALAGAGVSDLIEMQKWVHRRFHSTAPAARYWRGHIGDIIEDRDDLLAHSPAKLADRIKIPMFIFHGEDDEIVPIEQSRIMMAAMERAGKPFEWHEMKLTGHEFGNSNARRMETMTKVIAFLNKHLPPARIN